MERIKVVFPVPGPPVITDTLWESIWRGFPPAAGKGDGQFVEHFLGDQPGVRRYVGLRNGLHGCDAASNDGFGLVKHLGKYQWRTCRLCFVRSPPAHPIEPGDSSAVEPVSG
jgi:hypothetical protein